MQRARSPRPPRWHGTCVGRNRATGARPTQHSTFRAIVRARDVKSYQRGCTIWYTSDWHESCRRAHAHALAHAPDSEPCPTRRRRTPAHARTRSRPARRKRRASALGSFGPKLGAFANSLCRNVVQPASCVFVVHGSHFAPLFRCTLVHGPLRRNDLRGWHVRCTVYRCQRTADGASGPLKRPKENAARGLTVRTSGPILKARRQTRAPHGAAPKIARGAAAARKNATCKRTGTPAHKRARATSAYLGWTPGKPAGTHRSMA